MSESVSVNGRYLECSVSHEWWQITTLYSHATLFMPRAVVMPVVTAPATDAEVKEVLSDDGKRKIAREVLRRFIQAEATALGGSQIEWSDK